MTHAGNFGLIIIVTAMIMIAFIAIGVGLGFLVASMKHRRFMKASNKD